MLINFMFSVIAVCPNIYICCCHRNFSIIHSNSLYARCKHLTSGLSIFLIAFGDYAVTIVASLNGYKYAYGEILAITVTGQGTTPSPADVSLQWLPYVSGITSLGTISGGIVLDQEDCYRGNAWPCFSVSSGL